jgi:hypothetical protein
MDDFEKLAKLVGAPVQEAQGAGLPQSLSEAKALGSRWYFTGNPCKHGHVEQRSTATGMCNWCMRMHRAKPEVKEAQRLYQAKPETKEAQRLRRAKPEVKEVQRLYRANPKAKEAQRLYRANPKAKEARRMKNMKMTGDAVLFAINQTSIAAIRGRAPADIVTQCPEPQRSQLQGLINRIRADPKAGKAVIALLRTMRELRKTELAEAIFEVTKD